METGVLRTCDRECVRLKNQPARGFRSGFRAAEMENVEQVSLRFHTSLPIIRGKPTVKDFPADLPVCLVHGVIAFGSKYSLIQTGSYQIFFILTNSNMLYDINHQILIKTKPGNAWMLDNSVKCSSLHHQGQEHSTEKYNVVLIDLNIDISSKRAKTLCDNSMEIFVIIVLFMLCIVCKHHLCKAFIIFLKSVFFVVVYKINSRVLSDIQLNVNCIDEWHISDQILYQYIVRNHDDLIVIIHVENCRSGYEKSVYFNCIQYDRTRCKIRCCVHYITDRDRGAGIFHLRKKKLFQEQSQSDSTFFV